jgi:hypothetical protein
MSQPYVDVRNSAEVMTSPSAEKAMDEVARRVLWASYACQDAVSELYDGADTNKKFDQQVFVLLEFVYCYLHIAMRSALAELTNPQIKELQDHIGILVVTAVIESYFPAVSTETKFKMTQGFFDNINQAEEEYAQISGSALGQTEAEKAADRVSSIFMRLGFRIARFSGKPTEVSVALVSKTAINELVKDEIGPAVRKLRDIR